MIRIMIAIAIGRSHLERERSRIREKTKFGRWIRKKEEVAHPNSDFMGIGNRVAVVRVDDRVLANGHGIGLDVFGNAFGVA